MSVLFIGKVQMKVLFFLTPQPTPQDMIPLNFDKLVAGESGIQLTLWKEWKIWKIIQAKESFVFERLQECGHFFMKRSLRWSFGILILEIRSFFRSNK